MKVKWFSGAFLGMLILIAGVPTATQAGAPPDVYGVKLQFTGVAQGDGPPPPFIVKVKGHTNGLINLALGRDENAPVPANEVLAWVGLCGGDSSLIVYDTNTGSNLATIAIMLDHWDVNDPERGQFVSVFEVQSVGGVDNAIHDGFLVVTGTFEIGSNFCSPGGPLKVKASVVGAMDITITDEFGTHSGDVLITGGKLRTSPETPIGTLGP
jgi:hypothetical protein